MKSFKKYLGLILVSMLMIPLFTQAQDKKSKTEKVEIQTTAICDMCKERIEKNMAFEKGVTAVSLDSETKILTVEFKKGKTDKEKLKKAVSKIGYDADEVPADPKAYDRLPSCCKKDVAPH
jgi:mercuric ion binding protein